MPASLKLSERENAELAWRVFAYANVQEGPCCFLHGNGNQGSPLHRFHWLAGWGAVRYIRPEKPGDLEPVFGGDAEALWLGYLGYEWGEDAHVQESGADRGCFFLPQYWVRLGVNGLECSENLSLAMANPFNFFPEVVPGAINFSFGEIQADFTRDSYCTEVEKLLHHIAFGDFYEINFCNRHTVPDFKGDLFDLWRVLCRESPMPFAFYFRDEVVSIASASPERYLSRSGDRIHSEPMKGTRRRVEDPKRDAQLIEELRADEKEQAENVMIVDLVRNDLSRIAAVGTVQVDSLFEVRTYSTVHQMISEISCVCAPCYTSLDVLRATFPMGSMTGAPKVSAMHHIRKAEGRPRGAFSGAGGYVHSGSFFDLNVLIRSFIRYRDQTLTFWVGSAITSDCIPEVEWEECLVKARPLLRALSKPIK